MLAVFVGLVRVYGWYVPCTLGLGGSSWFFVGILVILAIKDDSLPTGEGGTAGRRQG